MVSKAALNRSTQNGTHDLADVVTVVPYFRNDGATIGSAVSAATDLRGQGTTISKINR
jgi:hypothetical protein